MSTPYEIPAEKLIVETAKDLKEKMKLKRPKWSLFLKTGAHKERMPDDENWWWIRAASILRKLYLQGGEVGVERLRTSYGSRKHRGVKPEKFHKSGGKIIRTILQEFDALGFTEKTKKGRKITNKGREYINKISSKVSTNT
jgi:small subunit ribosomal protein S19e